MIQEIQNMIMAIRDWTNGKFQKKGNYALADNAGYSLGLNIDSNYIMTIELKNVRGTVLSSKSIDFPIESMVVNAAYADGELTLILQNGQEITVDISSVVSGLVNDTFTIAGIDMEDNITEEELVNALGISEKVDKVEGKGLSTNDYTTEEKNKLSGIASGAEENVQSDWNVTDDTSDDFIKNKPTSMKNPNALTFTGGATGTYDGSSAKSVEIPTTLPASDVYAWAKEPTKPSYSKSEIGLENVPNVATNDQTPTFTQASTRENIASGEKLSVIFGKVAKWFADLKTVAFTGKYTDLVDAPPIPTKTSQLTNDSGFAKTESPTLTGTPTAPTPSANVNNTQIATTAYVKTLISNLINGAPETLDTLKEIADALGENDDAVQALNEAIGGKLDKDGDASNTNSIFAQSTTRENIGSGEKLSVLFGKIKKWFADLKTVAFTGNYNDLSNKPLSLPASDTTSSYSATGTAPVNGTAVNKAINTVEEKTFERNDEKAKMVIRAYKSGRVVSLFGSITYLTNTPLGSAGSLPAGYIPAASCYHSVFDVMAKNIPNNLAFIINGNNGIFAISNIPWDNTEIPIKDHRYIFNCTYITKD